MNKRQKYISREEVENNYTTNEDVERKIAEVHNKMWKKIGLLTIYIVISFLCWMTTSAPNALVTSYVFVNQSMNSNGGYLLEIHPLEAHSFLERCALLRMR